MKVLFLLCALCILGAALAADTCAFTATSSKTLTPGAATKLNIGSTATQYTNFEYKWIKATDTNIGLTAVVCSDSSVDADLFSYDFAVSGDSVNLNLVQRASLTTTTTGGSRTNTTSTTSSTMTSSTTTGPVNAGSAPSPSNMLYFILASLFILPKKRFSFAVLLVAMVIFMATDMATAYPSAVTKVTLTLTIPASVKEVCISGKCSPIAHDYISLFGKRFTAAGGLNSPCSNVTLYPMPYGWEIAPRDDPTYAAALIYQNWGSPSAQSYQVVITNAEGLSVGGPFRYVAGHDVWRRVPNNATYGGYDYGALYCEMSVVFSQANDPVDSSTDIAGLPKITTNFITFGGFDYAVSDNAAPSNVNTACSSYDVLISPDTTWEITPASGKDAAIVAVASATITFGTDCFLFTDSSAIDNIGNTCSSRRQLNSVTIGNGNLYYTNNTCGKPLLRRPSTLPDTINRNPTIAPLNTCTFHSQVYNVLGGLDGRDSTTYSQKSYLAMPTGYRFATLDELRDFVAAARPCFFAGSCFVTDTGSFLRESSGRACGTLSTKTANGINYYMPTYDQGALVLIVKA